MNPVLMYVRDRISGQNRTPEVDGDGRLRVVSSGGSGAVTGTVEVEQAAHDDLNCNANVQVGDADASDTNPLPVATDGRTITQTPTVTAGAYSAGDCVGGKLTFAAATREAGGGGVIKDMLIIDDAGQDVEMELWLFASDFTSPGDNAAWAPAEDDLEILCAIISTADGAWFAAGTPSVARVECSQRFDLGSGTSLLGQLVTRGTPTFANTDDITVNIGVLYD